MRTRELPPGVAVGDWLMEWLLKWLFPLAELLKLVPGGLQPGSQGPVSYSTIQWAAVALGRASTTPPPGKLL